MWWRKAPKALWQRGEDLAARHVKKNGYKILERNARYGRGEIDIIALDGDTVVFVEVRTRAIRDAVLPEESITETKRRHVRAAANSYISRKGNPDTYYRFDVVAVILPEKEKPEITLYRDAF